MNRILLVLPLLIGCSMGPNSETLVTELQILAVESTPQDVAVGEEHTLTVTVADPRDEGATVRIFRCDDTFGCQSVFGTLQNDQVSFTWTETIPVAVPMWVMACAPGVCDLENADDADLLDPVDWMTRLPTAGVSLSLRTPRYTTAPMDERDPGPVIQVAPDGVEETLPFTTDNADVAQGWVTAGGFSQTSYELNLFGEVELQWFPPDDDPSLEAPDDAWVVFRDEAGRQTVWRSPRD